MDFKHRFLKALSPTGFTQVHYTEWGLTSSQPPVICVHGMTRNCRDFDYLAQDLSNSRHIICPDMPGRGQSEWFPDPSDYTYDNYYPIFLSLLARLDVNQVDWIGTSMGGLLGMNLAARDQSPIRRLVINDVGARLPHQTLQKLRSYAGMSPTFSDFSKAERYIRQILAPFGQLSDDQWQHLTEHSIRDRGDKFVLSYDPKIVQQATRTTPDKDVNLFDQWDKIQCPILLIWGAQSNLLTQEIVLEMQARKPDLQLLKVQDAGHAPALMDATQIMTIKNFLNN